MLIIDLENAPFDRTYHHALSATLSEWDSAVDDEAYENLLHEEIKKF
jgi:hypothetical protein